MKVNDQEKLKAIEQLLELCTPSELRQTILQIFFYQIKNIERENLIPDQLHDHTENIQFLIQFLDQLDD